MPEPLQSPQQHVDSLLDAVRRGLTLTLGVGVLVVQHAQTQRQELKKTAPRLMGEITTAVGDRLQTIGEKLSDIGTSLDN